MARKEDFLAKTSGINFWLSNAHEILLNLKLFLKKTYDKKVLVILKIPHERNLKFSPSKIVLLKASTLLKKSQLVGFFSNPEIRKVYFKATKTKVENLFDLLAEKTEINFDMESIASLGLNSFFIADDKKLGIEKRQNFKKNYLTLNTAGRFFLISLILNRKHFLLKDFTQKKNPMNFLKKKFLKNALAKSQYRQLENNLVFDPLAKSTKDLSPNLDPRKFRLSLKAF